LNELDAIDEAVEDIIRHILPPCGKPDRQNGKDAE
jgi:hypothetical protein